MCLGEGTLEAYTRGVDVRIGLEEESDTPFVVVACGGNQSCGTEALLMNEPLDQYGAAGPWHVCLGEGTLEAYTRGVDARLGLEEESDTPFSVVFCGDHQSCVTAFLLMNDPESIM